MCLRTALASAFDVITRGAREGTSFQYISDCPSPKALA